MSNIELELIELLDTIKRLTLVTNDENHLLHLARIYGNLCWVNNTKLFEDAYWEKLFIDSLYEKYSKKVPSSNLTKDELHVVSECYAHGGHTRLLEQILKIRNTGDLLISRAEPDYREKLSIKSSCNVYSFNSDASIEDIIKIAHNYKIIYLHIHPDDIISTVAIGILKKKFGQNIKTIFVNHADHVFSYGFECADLIAEISLFGYKINKEYRANKGSKSFFMGIPLDFYEKDLAGFEISFDKIINIFSGGSDYKYKPFEDYDFPAVIKKITKEIPTSRLVVVGALESNSYWQCLIEELNVFLYKTLSYDEYLEKSLQADLCIDSYPMPGGTAFPDAWVKGKLVTGLKVPIRGYTVLESLKFDTQQDLIAAVVELYNKKEQSQIYKLNISCELREKFILNHSFRNVGIRLNDALKSETVCFEYISDYELSENDSLFFYKRWHAGALFNIDLKHLMNLSEMFIKQDLLLANALLINLSSHLVVELLNSNYSIISNMRKSLDEMEVIQQQKDNMIEYLNTDLKNYKSEINRIYDSFGWRLARPFRLLIKIIKLVFYRAN
ncbi:hypothetical protein [Francisella philomiragia]|uniref:hypothetical protein n=1 Tax=Francisella philomiragia TaxID=28110 RepID=UPI0035145C94